MVDFLAESHTRRARRGGRVERRALMTRCPPAANRAVSHRVTLRGTDAEECTHPIVSDPVDWTVLSESTVVEPPEGAEVGPAAAGCAQHQLHVGMATRHLGHHLPRGGDAIQRQVALAVGCERGGSRLGDVAVGIPLEVGDAGVRGEDPVDGVDHEGPDVGAAEVEHELLPFLAPVPARLADDPLRMVAVQVGHRVHHLRFHPQPEPHAPLEGVLDERTEPGGELAGVGVPVTQRGGVVVARVRGAEPPVVEEVELGAEVGRPIDCSRDRPTNAKPTASSVDHGGRVGRRREPTRSRPAVSAGCGAIPSFDHVHTTAGEVKVSPGRGPAGAAVWCRDE